MTLNDLRKQREEEVRIVVEDWPQSKLLIAYQYIHGRGISLTNIDAEIEKALRLELKAA